MKGIFVTIDLRITKQGEMRAIAPDDLSKLSCFGQLSVRRVSHVEPLQTESGLQWTADLSPVDGPLLGPFQTRSQAIAAELAWLRDNLADLS